MEFLFSWKKVESYEWYWLQWTEKHARKNGENWKTKDENLHLQQFDALFNPNSRINKTFQIKL